MYKRNLTITSNPIPVIEALLAIKARFELAPSDGDWCVTVLADQYEACRKAIAEAPVWSE